ncbi:uncharacterized protein CIMG_12602 [Coccidioides immitis RS]|uniref:Uncharacterized protein n=1 Tax=Coccidioides immitis (strain RS) TaxID=246410 RepID=J3KMF0_COCIM|nr:uncharacterized protein CIMG_12602 [Coccidioides immitis RS]EAS37578.3 hypothetical protein CIMG_12602 [Coccidioides immitis RS]
MTKDQEIKKSGSESTMVEGTTESYTTMSQEGYKKGNWEVFSKEIIHEFHDQNITYKIHYQNYLQAITKKPHAWDSNICAYIQEYTTITSTVQANGRLDEFTKMSWFLQELPEKLQNKIIDKAKLNLSDNMSPIDFRKVVQKKMEKLASSVKTEESESKSKVKSSESTNIKAAIEKMTNKFTNLALAMRVQSNQIQENSDQYYMLQREGPPKPIPNYTTNVITNSAMVQENTQPQLVNSYVAQNSSPMTSYYSSDQGGA